MKNVSVLVIAVALSALPGCVYFNTFYNARKFYNEAEEKRQKAEADPKVSARSYHQLYDKAIKKASMILQFHPDSKWVDDSLFLLGKAFYWKGEYPKAARKFEELQANFPESKFAEEVRYWYGLSLWRMKRYDLASELFHELVKKKGFDLSDDALFALGEMKFELEDYEGALEEYKKLLSLFGDSPLKADVWSRMGESNMALGRYDQAIRSFQKALEHKPGLGTDYSSRVKIGECLEAQDRFEKALGIYKSLLKKEKFQAYASQVRLKIANCQEHLGRIDEALKEYERVTELFPKSEDAAEALYRMGTIYQMRPGELGRAKELFDRVGRENPTADVVKLAKARSADLATLEKYRLETSKGNGSAQTLFLLAELYLFRLEQPDSALKAYNKVVEQFPEDDLAPKAAYSIGWVKEEVLGDSTGARSAFEKLIVEYPRTEYAEAARERLSLEERDEDPAKEKFLRVESLRLDGAEPESYLSRLEEIASDYPQSPYAPKASYVVAWTYENVVKDSALAHQYYEKLIELFPDSQFAEVARKKLEAEKALETPPGEKTEQDSTGTKQLGSEQMSPGDELLVETAETFEK